MHWWRLSSGGIVCIKTKMRISKNMGLFWRSYRGIKSGRDFNGGTWFRVIKRLHALAFMSATTIYLIGFQTKMRISHYVYLELCAVSRERCTHIYVYIFVMKPKGITYSSKWFSSISIWERIGTRHKFQVEIIYFIRLLLERKTIP